ncbi:MAG: sigma-70 family RNA polymerase sigma factor [Verrucomicrobiae bacterium]|nr:sigma-70 family RNA polymerase sigma factor [Verrucomicrobiae bacterium]
MKGTSATCFRLALLFTRVDQVAPSDVVQDTLRRVARHAREFDNEETFWCRSCAIVRSTARDAGRKNNRHLGLIINAQRYLPVNASDPSQFEQCLEEPAERCLNQLDPADRALVENKYLEHRTVRELAQHSHLTEKAVESRLYRLGQQLRMRLPELLRNYD